MKNRPEAIYPIYRRGELVAFTKFDEGKPVPRLYKVEPMSLEEVAEITSNQ